MVISAVLPACGRPTGTRWLSIMIAPRDDTRRLTCKGPGRHGGAAVPARAPRNRARARSGTGQATVRTTAPPDRMLAMGPSSRSLALAFHEQDAAGLDRAVVVQIRCPGIGAGSRFRCGLDGGPSLGEGDEVASCALQRDGVGKGSLGVILLVLAMVVREILHHGQQHVAFSAGLVARWSGVVALEVRTDRWGARRFWGAPASIRHLPHRSSAGGRSREVATRRTTGS